MPIRNMLRPTRLSLTNVQVHHFQNRRDCPIIAHVSYLERAYMWLVKMVNASEKDGTIHGRGKSDRQADRQLSPHRRDRSRKLWDSLPSATCLPEQPYRSP